MREMKERKRERERERELERVWKQEYDTKQDKEV